MVEALLAERVAIVTGSGQGIGREIARSLGAFGAQVVLVDIDGDAAKAAAEEIDATQLTAGPAEALAVIKSLLAVAPGLSPFNVLDREAAHQAALSGSDDFVKGVAAFREKRRAVFGARKGVRE
jgi:2-(1,2-epoxy-1,2-dihydrophenyl)acetyl-CoA isomerase